MRNPAIVTLLFVVAGCAQSLSVEPGRYRNYHDMRMGFIEESLAGNPAPTEVKHRFARCLSSWLGQYMRPDERARLDAYARGDREISEREMREITESMWAATPLKRQMTSADLPILEGLCPNDVPTFQAYNLPK